MILLLPLLNKKTGAGGNLFAARAMYIQKIMKAPCMKCLLSKELPGFEIFSECLW
jgi:hypothetical protein